MLKSLVFHTGQTATTRMRSVEVGNTHMGRKGLRVENGGRGVEEALGGGEPLIRREEHGRAEACVCEVGRLRRPGRASLGCEDADGTVIELLTYAEAEAGARTRGRKQGIEVRRGLRGLRKWQGCERRRRVDKSGSTSAIVRFWVHCCR